MQEEQDDDDSTDNRPSRGADTTSARTIRLYEDGPQEDVEQAPSWSAGTRVLSVSGGTTGRSSVPLNNDEQMGVCVIELTFAEKRCRILVDTGAARSMIRSRVAQQLRENENTRAAFLRREELNKPLNCEGAEKGRVIGCITHRSWFRVKFDINEPEVSCEKAFYQDLQKCRDKKPKFIELEVPFHELESLNDPIIIGLPQCQNWGLTLEPPDEFGRKWVQFGQLGTRHAVIGTQKSKITIVRPGYVHGPGLTTFDVEAPLDWIDGLIE